MRIERKIYHATEEYAAYSWQKHTAGKAGSHFEFDGKLWLYAYTTSDSRGVYDLIYRYEANDFPPVSVQELSRFELAAIAALAGLASKPETEKLTPKVTATIAIKMAEALDAELDRATVRREN